MPAKPPHPNTVQTAQRSDWLASSPHERDSPEIIIDLGPYVNCPTQTLIKEEDEKEHDVRRKRRTDRTPEDRKGTRTLQTTSLDATTKSDATTVTQPPPSPAGMWTRQRLIEETWTVKYKLPPQIRLEVGQKILLKHKNTSTRRLGIISTISQRSKAEVVFRIMEEPMVDPNTVIYLSTPIRYTKFTKDVGILSWISSNLFRRRSLKEPPTETVTETQAKAQRDAIQKRSNEMHTFPKRVKAGTRARTSSLGAEKALDHRKQLKVRFAELPETNQSTKNTQE
ncbi:hypothetical protein BKA70DRAFT_1237069 [Coprinopsis sp. MPI-PUGE-AT-0042]|nr:hypothetical protein BKA70DRAFT_1237069 [Coprinopsis sp. MPI-PUGE-AT-0042]